MKLAYINLLWIVFTILGVIIFGFFPAYTAMLTIVRKWIIGEADIPVFNTFFTVYKKEFFRSNFIGLLLLLISYILYVDLSIVMEANGIINLITFPMFLIIIGFFLASCYTFPIIVHYETKIGQALKNSFIIMALSPFSTIMMIIGTIAIYFLMTTIPGLFPFFCASTLAFIIMWSALLAFSKIEKRQESYTQTRVEQVESQ